MQRRVQRARQNSLYTQHKFWRAIASLALLNMHQVTQNGIIYGKFLIWGILKSLVFLKMSNKSKKQDIYCNSFNKYRTCTGYIVFNLIILSIIYVYKLEKRITSIGHNNIKFTNTCIIYKKLSHFLKIYRIQIT